ncbi:MAG TPA: antibiotic biosynthesis monooxygenase [Methylophaga sp.]|nr:antibiotic biosynthesis monooxygenase [Methylophaga sp.]
MQPISDNSHFEGSTAVITHQVAKNKHAEYEAWLNEIAPQCKNATGHLDWQIIRPIAGLTETFTIVIRFDTQSHLRGWMESAQRNELIQKVSPLLVKGDDFYISSGLDFWFTPEKANTKIPIRWKQALVTWSAIYPLVLILPLLVLPTMHEMGLPESRYLDTLVVTGIAVLLMVYLVMPRYTKLIHRWLFRGC